MPATRARSLEVGLNYAWPWNKFGVYFGSGEHCPGENREYDAWVENLGRNLDAMAAVSVRVVRMFLFCNAHNLGSLVRDRARASGWAFRMPERLDPIYTLQLEGMLRAFRARGMQVIPSLLSFEALAEWQPSPTFGGGGRASIASDPGTRDVFLDRVLRPLLEVSAGHREAVYAWEIVNEPALVMDGLEHRLRRAWGIKKTDHPVAREAMARFLEKAVAMVDRHGLPSTVGHLTARDLRRLPTGSVRQFHYYPQAVPLLDNALPPYSETRAIVGELAADDIPPDQRRGALWPEIARADQADGTTRTLRRLALLEKKGYGLALLWPDRAPEFDPARPALDPLHFSPEVLHGIAAFQRPPAS